MFFQKLAVSVFLLTVASATKYTDCGSKSGRVTDVRVSGCEGKEVCELPRGSTQKIEIDFESLQGTETLKTVVYGIINGVAWPFNFPKPNACEDSNLQCPLNSGENHSYATEMEIKNYPQVRVDVRWELKDERKDDMVCVLIPAQIV